ncbi:MAG: TrkA family potassium uptake protein [Candidatus Aenigmatarchaeota archaeon]|nr:TrkA family potassium uptake protein [Nanoarchaeota archaeon]
MRLIICGGGSLGTKLADVFVKEKNDVIMIEKNSIIAEKLGEKLDALVLHGDASDIKILKDAGIENCDALLVVTSDDKTNLLICEIAKSFKVGKIISRVNDAENDGIFMKLGITSAINTTTTAVVSFKKAIQDPGKRIIGLIAGDQAGIYERLVTKKSQVLNKKISEFPTNMAVCAIQRNGEYIFPKQGTALQEGDIVTISAGIQLLNNVDKLFGLK